MAMKLPSQYTADEIEAAIPGAIRDGNFRAVDGLVRLLARKDADRAAAVIETMQLGIDIRKARP